MLREKMIAVMGDLEKEVAERTELIFALQWRCWHG